MRLRKLQLQARTFGLISLLALLVVIVAAVYFAVTYLNTGTSEREVDIVIVAVLRQGALVLLPALLIAILARLVVRRNRRAIHTEQERIEAGLRQRPEQ